MKIRTDFVTNSSSSSFSVVVTVTDKKGKKYVYEKQPWGEDGMHEIVFDADLNKLINNKKKDRPFVMDNVADLARFLVNAVYDSSDGPSSNGKKLSEKKEIFFYQLVQSNPELANLAKIAVQRDYYAWGEYADPVPENDKKLCELAKKVTGSTGSGKEAALDDMLEYIKTASFTGDFSSFGKGYSIRYSWDGDRSDLLKLAEYLVNHKGSISYEGREYDELDIATKTTDSFAEFYLKVK